MPQLFGLTLLANASYFLQIVGMEASLSVMFLIIGIVLGLLANVVSIWIVSAVRRRPLFLLTLVISTALWLGMGIAGCWSGTVVVWYTAVAMLAVVVVCGVGVWPTSYIVSGETSSLHLRAKTQGIGRFIGGFSTGIFGIALPYVFNPDEGSLRAKTGFVYAGLCAIALVVSWLIVPEMKGRSAVEIDRMFELGLPARQFERWPNDSDTKENSLV